MQIQGRGVRTEVGSEESFGLFALVGGGGGGGAGFEECEP